MPTLRPLTELRYDAAFFVDVVVPAVRAAGFEGTIALAPGDADVVVETADVDALLAGKLKTELDALDRLRRTTTRATTVRGRAAALRALALALTPKTAAPARGARDVAHEAPARQRKDRVRRAGRYIKGRGAAVSAPAGAGVPPASAAAPAMTRAAFALANLRTFVDAGLARVQDVDDDATIAIGPGEVKR